MSRKFRAPALGLFIGLACTIASAPSFAGPPYGYNGYSDGPNIRITYRNRDQNSVYSGDITAINYRTGYVNIVDRAGYGYHVDARNAQVFVDGRPANFNDIRSSDQLRIVGYVPSGALLVAQEIRVNTGGRRGDDGPVYQNRRGPRGRRNNDGRDGWNRNNDDRRDGDGD